MATREGLSEERDSPGKGNGERAAGSGDSVCGCLEEAETGWWPGAAVA